MRIASTAMDSIVDGPGLRFTVFTQGCPHRCPGCHNPQTHDPAGGRLASVDELTALMLSNPLLGGLTLSGGDPFVQAVECARLAARARAKGLDVWTYTGYTWEEILAAQNPEWGVLLDMTDVLVDGPFLMEHKSYAARFRGSLNQRLIDVAASRATGNLVLWRPVDPLAHFVPPAS